ncbi:MAG: hypothetical protein R3E08_01410 [Thiotrichaceae bacterium]
MLPAKSMVLSLATLTVDLKASASTDTPPEIVAEIPSRPPPVLLMVAALRR